MESIVYLKGDATSPVGDGQKLIVHICNDIGGWGKGFVLAISKKWKAPELKYREWFKLQEKFELGEIQIVKVESDIAVVNMIAQHKVRKTNRTPPIRYEALEQCLYKVGEFALKEKASIHMPRIGCGLAGGEWSKVEEIIEKTLLKKNLKVNVYDFE